MRNSSMIPSTTVDRVDRIPVARYGNSKCHSIWRPITEPDHDCPLALCDFRTVRKEDLVSADVIFPHYCDEGYELYYSPAHRWFYKRGMLTNKVILFKLDDSSGSEAKCEF